MPDCIEAKRFAAGEVVRSWDHGDLAEAVRNLDKTLKEVNAKVSVDFDTPFCKH